MFNDKPNPIRDKSYAFSLKLVPFCRILMEDKREYVLSRQLIKSGTSIGANVEEGVNAPTKKDFAHKLSISLKEAFETRYWLCLLRDTHYAEEGIANQLIDDAQELIALLTAILKSSRANLTEE